MSYYHLFWNSKKQEPYVIKAGFSFYAFLFGFLYFLYHRAWISTVAFIMLSLMVTALEMAFSLLDTLHVFMSLALSVYIGFDAQDCLFGEYYKKGYTYLKSDFYSSSEMAEAEIFKLI